MKMKLWLAGLALTATLVGLGRPALAQDKREPGSFGSLEMTSSDAVKAKALAWLKKATNNDAARLRTFDTLWSRSDRSVLENLADTFALGNADAGKLLAVVRNAE